MEYSDIVKLVRRGWWATRGGLLFILPLPLMLALLVSLARGELTAALVDLSALALFFAGAVYTKKGFRKQAELEKQGLRFNSQGSPYKSLGAACVALATFITSYFAVGNSGQFSFLLSMLCLLGFYFSYGFDALSVKRTLDPELGVTAEELESTLNEALRKIESIEIASRRVSNEELQHRLQRIVIQARSILANIEASPKDLHRARKFLYVYLDGAKRVCEGYAKTHEKLHSLQLEDNFRNVLITIEDVFKRQESRLLEKEILDLDVQIEVLNKQLKREGIF